MQYQFRPDQSCVFYAYSFVCLLYICFDMIVMSQSHSKEHNSRTHTHARLHRKRNKNSVYIVTQIELRIRAYQTNIDTGTQINPVQWTKTIKNTKNEEKKNNVCNWFEQTSLKKNINYLMNILVCCIVSYIIILFFFSSLSSKILEWWLWIDLVLAYLINRSSKLLIFLCLHLNDLPLFFVCTEYQLCCQLF